MAATFDTLLGYCLVELPGCPDLLVSSALNMSARALCLESSAWEETQSLILVSGQSEYPLTVPTDGVARNVRSVTFNNRALSPTQLSTVLDMSPGELSAIGEPTKYYMSVDMKVHLIPVPGDYVAGQEIKAHVAFVPEIGSTTLPTALVERHAETLICGAKARLMAMPEKSWSNPQLAMINQTAFADGVTKARIDAMHSYGRGDLTVKPRRF